jgi:hypothetical protein
MPAAAVTLASSSSVINHGVASRLVGGRSLPPVSGLGEGSGELVGLGEGSGELVGLGEGSGELVGLGEGSGELVGLGVGVGEGVGVSVVSVMYASSCPTFAPYTAVNTLSPSVQNEVG